MMKMPGFNAEAALRASVGPFWSAKQVPGRTAGVVPAGGLSPCCTTCFTVCASDPNGFACKWCRSMPCNPFC